MTIKHASFMDVVDGYERKDEQDKKRLAALENLLATVLHGRTPAEAADHWRRMTKVAALTRLPRTHSQFNVIANAIERVASEAPGILSFPMSDTAPDYKEEAC